MSCPGTHRQNTGVQEAAFAHGSTSVWMGVDSRRRSSWLVEARLRILPAGERDDGRRRCEVRRVPGIWAQVVALSVLMRVGPFAVPRAFPREPVRKTISPNLTRCPPA